MKKLLFFIFSYLLITVTANALEFSIGNGYKKYNLIYASGRFVKGDLKRLKYVYKQLPKYKQTIIVLSSPGGVMQEGIKLGSFIYSNKIGTAVAKNSICASSCALAFLGGRDKYGRKLMILPRGSKLGFHSFYYNNSRYVTSEQIQKDFSSVLTYVTNVGAPSNLIISMFNTPHSKMHWVSHSTMSKLKIKRAISGLKIKSYGNRYGYNVTASNKNSKVLFIKNYFKEINDVISRTLTQKRVALNSIYSTSYIYWLSKNLRQIKIGNKIRVKSGNRVETIVYYMLKNGVRVCSKNTYKLKRQQDNNWKIATKELSPCDNRSKAYINYLSYRLP